MEPQKIKVEVENVRGVENIYIRNYLTGIAVFGIMFILGLILKWW